MILELRGDPVPADMRTREIAVWQALPAVPAVQHHRVYFIDQQATVVPGPRVGEGVELLARALHPEVFK